MTVWIQDEFGRSVHVPYGSNIRDFIESLESASVKQAPSPEQQSVGLDFPVVTPLAQSILSVNKPETTRLLRFFLCHSNKDKPLVRSLYRWLRAENTDP